MWIPPAPASMNNLVNFMTEVVPPNPASASAIIGAK